MFKRTITYKDLDGNTFTEDFYFHYSTAEATELKAVFGENMQDRIQALIQTKNAKEVIHIFRGVIADSVGRKSANGKSFIKTDEFRDEFMGSDAYSEMLLWLLSDQNNMALLVNGLFPKNMTERVGVLAEARGVKTTVDLPTENQTSISSVLPKPNLTVVSEKKFSDYTREELLAMPQDEFRALSAKA